MDAWKKQMQDDTTAATFVADGGAVVRNVKDLPDQFRRETAHMPQPCTREKQNVQQCFEKRLGMECQPLLDAFNKCEERYFTKKQVDTIGDVERKLHGE